jgi:mannitol/fructose-specific phosphotransferase system IIA component (Ntr-type)
MSALLSEILDPRLVVLQLRAATEGDAILEIAELFRQNGFVQKYYEFADAVMEREGRSSTNTGEGAAFPHARTDLVERIVLGIGRSEKGVRFGETKEPVHLIFLIGVPKKMVNDFLVCVGALARVVKEKSRRDALLAAMTAEELIEQLRAGALALE